MNNREYPWLERATAVVLVLVLATLAWMVVATWRPDWNSWLALELQVWVVLGLLTAALLLVSAVALLHTRSE
jgi:hypothetical protein